MEMAQVAEHRKHPRIEVKWPVTMMTPEGEMKGQIENISAGGAYINCEMLLSKHDRFTMTIQTSDQELLWIGAEVIWIDIPINPDGESVAIGIGVRFTDISAEYLQCLSNMVA